MPGERLGGRDSSVRIDLRDLGELGHRDVAELHAGARQPGQCRLDTRRDVRFHVVPDQRPGDEKTQSRSGHGGGHVTGQPGHHGIEHRAALNRARDGTDGIERAGQRVDATPRDSVCRRLEPDQAAERGWNPNGATGVGADGRHAHSVRDRDSGTRRGAPGNSRARAIEGIARRSVMRIETDPGVGELRHVGLADDDRARVAEPGDGVGIDRRGGRIGQHA